MLLIYAVFFFTVIVTVQGIYKAVKNKSLEELFFAIMPFPFFFSFFVSLISGGSALHDAQTEYALYQTGHYYLTSHGVWTEVSYGRYLFVLVSEIIGFSSLAVGMVASVRREAKRRHQNPDRLSHN